jgi:DNA polymerase-3 subunit epsilon
MSEENKPVFCFLDIETSGLDPNKHQILEIAAVRCTWKDGHFIEEGNMENRVALYKGDGFFTNLVDPRILDINKYNRDDGPVYSPIYTVLGRLIDLAKGAIICGSKPSFDLGFIQVALDDMGWLPLPMKGHHPIDITSLGFLFLANGYISKMGQGVLAKYLQLEEQEHMAMADVRQCMEIARYFLGACIQRIGM